MVLKILILVRVKDVFDCQHSNEHLAGFVYQQVEFTVAPIFVNARPEQVLQLEKNLVLMLDLSQRLDERLVSTGDYLHKLEQGFRKHSKK